MSLIINVCKRRKLKVSIGGRTERGENLDLSLNGEMLEKVHSFKYL